MEEKYANRMIDPAELECRESDHLQAHLARLARHKKALMHLSVELTERPTIGNHSLAAKK